MLIIYHSADLDGWMSAAILKEQYPDAKLLGFNYGEPIPEIQEEEIIIMVDVSFPMQDMLLLANKVEKFTWIDHHDRTISQFKDFTNGNPIFGYFPGEIKLAACELTWLWLHNTDPPESVRLLGAYDTFRHKDTQETQDVLNFQYGAQALATNPEEAQRLIYLDDPSIARVKFMGENIHKYLCNDAKIKYAKSFVVNFDGYRFITCNTERFNPVNFGIDYHKDGYDGAACFWYEKGHWNFSLYNDNGKVDCSLICSKRGGGGHKGASGFQTENLFSII
jgi:oligoribonuclease NrnB/cAMP/cGMP phosphodiesterase (DHH superfamily)